VTGERPKAWKNPLAWPPHSIAEAVLAANPVKTVARSHARLGLTFSDAAHTYDLADYVRKAFSEYPGTYDAST
jgi:hypothetical protein